jgi:ParB family chromosome partitioning protein
MNGQRFVHVDRVHPNPRNVREDLGDLTETAASIAVHGVLQPIVVRQHPDIPGAFEVLAGHRRLEAAKIAGRESVPVVVREILPGTEVEELMLIENCHRAELGPMEKAKAMGALAAKGYTATKIARSIGMSRPAVSYYLTLLELDPGSQERVQSGELSAADAVDIVRHIRKRQRASRGAAPVGPVWEPDHFTGKHPLARKARALCDVRKHTARRRIGKVACGQCWEDAIRQDEQTARAALRSVS